MLIFDKRFIVNRALSGTDKYCSFQSLLFPGYWLRHDKNFGLQLDKYVDTVKFKNTGNYHNSYLSVSNLEDELWISQRRYSSDSFD